MKNTIRPEEKIVALLASQSPNRDRWRRILKICDERTPDWYTVYTIAREHGIAALAGANLKACPDLVTQVPQSILDHFTEQETLNRRNKQRERVLLVAALAELNEAGLDVMVMKGAALDLVVYDQPWYVDAASDVDLLVKSKDGPLSEHQTETIGNLLKIPALRFEVDYFQHHDITLNGVLVVKAADMWSDASVISIGARPAYIMCPEDMLIVACISSCRKRLFCLKRLMHIAEILQRFPCLNWDKVAGKAKAYGCGAMVYAGLLASQTMIGVDPGNSLSIDFGVHPLRAVVLRYVIARRYFSSSSFFTGPKYHGQPLGWAMAVSLLTLTWKQLVQLVYIYWAGIPSPAFRNGGAVSG